MSEKGEPRASVLPWQSEGSHSSLGGRALPEGVVERMLAQTSELLYLLDRDERVCWLNRTAYGLGPEQVLGQKASMLGRPEAREKLRARFELALETGLTQSWEGFQRDADTGVLSTVQVSLVPLGPAGAVEWVLLTATDVSHLRRAERERDEATHRLDMARRSSGVGLWSYVAGEDALLFDEGMARLLGLGEEPLRCPLVTVWRFLSDSDRPGLERRALSALSDAHPGGVLPTLEVRVQRADGDPRWMLLSGRRYEHPDGRAREFVGSALDITERRSLEEQLQGAQRRELIGRMAAGLAHNFNNVLTVLGPSLALASQRAPAVEPLLSRAREAVEQATGLVRELMLIAGTRGEHTLRQCRPGPAMKGVAELFRSTLRSSYTLALEVAADTPTVLAVPGQLEQALLNLLLNARDAVEEAPSGEGRIEVRVGRVLHEATPWLSVSVRDNGAGMTEAVRARLFEPFFTTKPEGRGTGLGMATTAAIVRAHRGQLRCASLPGEGTIFLLEVPALPEP